MKLSSIPKSGRKGSVVYLNTRYGKVAREYVRPSNPRTPEQQDHRNNVRASVLTIYTYGLGLFALWGAAEAAHRACRSLKVRTLALALAQRAVTARTAISLRRSAVSFRARALPPFSPPSRPSATAAAFFFAPQPVFSQSPTSATPTGAHSAIQTEPGAAVCRLPHRCPYIAQG
jgi:hypothetical protein